VPQVAIGWLLARPGVTSVLIGATKLHQLDDNLGAADISLMDEDIAALDEATAVAPIYPTTQWIEPDFRMKRALAPHTS
jgi:aryl-alcohol dehydrogenase-like predicted oxidoreductase